MQQPSSRIEWVDIFKCFGIILVVVGHCASPLNKYIYQFHMAAFFFIAGYTTTLGKRKIFPTIVLRCYKLLLPFLTAFFGGLVINEILLATGQYTLFNSNLYPGAFNAIKRLFQAGDCYVYWLGAAWFLLALLGIQILEEILFRIVSKKYTLFFWMISIGLWIGAYVYLNADMDIRLGLFNPLFILMGQIYYCTGIFFREKRIDRLINHTPVKVFALILGIFSLYWFGNIKLITVDYPSRKFNLPLWDYLAAMGGILFLLIVSKLGEYLPNKIRRCVAELGHNTLGILLFHFFAYKIIVFILYILGYANGSQLQSLVPIDGHEQWWLLFAVSEVVLSYMIWRILQHINCLNTLFGQNISVQIKLINVFEKLENHINESKQMSRLNTNTKKIRMFLKENRIIVLIIIIAVVLWAIPIMQTGINCNDELQTRLYRMGGLKNVFTHYLGIEASNRVIRILAAVNLPLGFIFENQILNRIWQILFLLTSFAIFGYAMARIFNHKKFGLCCALFMMMFLPVTYELSVPNAFVTLVTIPFILLMFSFILYIRYIEKRTWRRLIASMAVYFLAMMGYEFVVTFVLLFPLIAFYKLPSNERKFSNLLKECIVPFSTGICYIALLFISQALASSDLYSGTKMTFVSLGSSFEIIKTLALSALPGYFLFNPKYRYLNTIALADEILSEGYVGIILEFGIPAILIVVLLLYCLRYFMKRISNKQSNKKFLIWPLLIGVLYLGIPAMPNSITSLYQGTVTDSSFTSLPVSFFLHAIATFVCIYLVWIIAKKWKAIGYILIASISILSCMILGNNRIVAMEQKSDYEHLSMLETSLKTNVAKSFEGRDIFAPEWFAQKHNLAIHDGYFTQFSEMNGLDLNIQNAVYNKNALNPSYMSIIGDDGVLFQIENEVAVLMKKPITEEFPVILADGQAVIVPTTTTTIIDTGFYVGSYKISEDNTLEPMASLPFQGIQTRVGNTLDTAEKTGITNDGWCKEDAEIRIRTASEGLIVLDGYVPEVPENAQIFIYINDNEEPHVYDIKENNFSITIEALPQQETSFRITTNFAHQASEQDDRIVSFILLNVSGM